MGPLVTRDELLERLVALEEWPKPEETREFIDATVAELDAGLRLALDVCDALHGTVNLPELLSLALAGIAEELGGEEELVRHRPGSWEAEHVRRLGMVLA